MTFSEKLNILMNLTGTSNSELGRALSYDPSYISRVRAGKRGLPRRQPFVKPASEFFAEAIVTPVQQDAAANLLTRGMPWPEDPKQGAEYLLRWLEATPEEMSEPLGQFFQSISTAAPAELKSEVQLDLTPTEEDTVFFYGNEGKREAVLRLLADACENRAGTLHLVSDESMAWLAESVSFQRRWIAMLIRFLEQGGQITIIHTIDRSLDEMLLAVQRWMPLYMTGRIQSYYCPRVRDGICRRSLFVAPGLAALVGCSILENTENMANLLTREPKAVAGYEEEFNNYLAICRPLIDIYREGQGQELEKRFLHLLTGDGPLLTASPIPFAPGRSGSPAMEQAFQQRLTRGEEVMELLHLPDPSDRDLGPLPLPLSDMMGTSDQSYTPEELRDRVRDAMERCRQYHNYRAVFTHRLPAAITILARNREEVLIFPSAPPTTVFALAEPRLVSALWDYLQRAVGQSDQKRSYRRLEHWVEDMDKVLDKEK